MTAQARAYAVSGSGAVFTGPCTYRGFWLVSGAAQTVTIYDGTGASGTVLAQFTAAGADEDHHEAVPDGIRCDAGIYVDVSADAVTGSVRIG